MWGVLCKYCTAGSLLYISITTFIQSANMIRRQNGRNLSLPAMSAINQEYFIRCYRVGGHHTALARFETMISIILLNVAMCESQTGNMWFSICNAVTREHLASCLKLEHVHLHKDKYFCECTEMFTRIFVTVNRGKTSLIVIRVGNWIHFKCFIFHSPRFIIHCTLTTVCAETKHIDLFKVNYPWHLGRSF